MKKISVKLLPVIYFVFLIIIIFFPFFTKGQIPFPGNYMLAWYEPWKSNFSLNGKILIPHKAVGEDTFRQLFPYKNLAADFIKNGSFPLWNSFNGSGMPLMATMHAGFLTPFNLLFVMLPGFLAWSFYVMSQPVLLGIMIYLYCRRIKLSKISSIFSSTCFVLSGFSISRLIYGEYLYSFAILPLNLYLFESFFSDKKNRNILFLPFAIFFLFISGQPQIIFYVGLTSFIYFLVRSIQERLSIKKIIFIFILTLLGIGLSSIQFVPTFELYRLSAINSLSSKFIIDRFLLPLQSLITIVIPNFFGNPGTYNFWGFGDYTETIAYLGTIPVLFAFLAIRKNKILFFFLSLFVFTIFLSLKSPITTFLFSLPIPILSTGAPSRILALSIFSLSILAGFGFEYWLETKKFSKADFLRIGGLLSILFLIFLTSFFMKIYNFPHCPKQILDCHTISMRNLALETIVLTTGLLILFAKLFFNNKTRFALVMIALIILIGVYNSNKILPFSDKYSFYPNTSLTSFLKNSKTYDRIFGLGEANIKTDISTYLKIFDPDFYDPLYFSKYGQLVSFANNGKVEKILPRSDVEITNDIMVSKETEKRRIKLFSLLGVNYLIFKKSEVGRINDIYWQDKTWSVKKFNNSRVNIVSRFIVEPNDLSALKRLFSVDFDPKKEVILEKKPEVNLNSGEKGTAKIISDKGNLITIESNTDGPAVLVLSDNFYPGWKAFVNNKEVNIYRANYSFRALLVPGGKNIVRFMYDPLSFKIGEILSFVSFLILLLIFLKRALIFKSVFN